MDSENVGRHVGIKFVFVVVSCKSIRWCVCTISEHDSHWTSSFEWLDFISLHEKCPQDWNDDGSFDLYGNQQCDVGRARSLQSIPYVIGTLASDDPDDEDE